MTKYGTSMNRVPYIPGPLSLCNIYGHDYETLASGAIVCHECGAVHRQHIWKDMNEGGPVRLLPTGPEDTIQEKVVCIICKLEKEEWDRIHTNSVPQGQEIP